MESVYNRFADVMTKLVMEMTATLEEYQNILSEDKLLTKEQMMEMDRILFLIPKITQLAKDVLNHVRETI